MGDFLKLEWKKFILPIILIVLFFLVINSLHTSGSIGDKYDCQIVGLIQDNILSMQKNDTSAVAQTDSEMKLLSQNKQTEMRKIQYAMPISGFIRVINPITPFPCEDLGKSNICKFYITKDTYNCLKSLDASGDIFSQPKMSVYKPTSLGLILLNVLLLLVEGYLISAIILLIYRKIRNKSDESPSNYSSSYTLPSSA